MSQVFYSDSFTDSMGDSPYTYTSTVGTSTTLRRGGPVHSFEFPPFMGGPGHGLWSNEHPSTTGPHSIMNHLGYLPQASHANTMEHDSLPHSIMQLAEHLETQMNHDDYQVPIVAGPLQPDYHASMAPMPEVPSDSPLGYVPVLDNIATPSGGNLSPIHSGISDDEDLKHLAKGYLNNRHAHVDKLLVRRRFQGGHRVLILLEIDDTM